MSYFTTPDGNTAYVPNDEDRALLPTGSVPVEPADSMSPVADPVADIHMAYATHRRQLAVEEISSALQVSVEAAGRVYDAIIG